MAWSHQLNLSNVAPASAGPRKVPRGVYKAQITASEKKVSKKKNEALVFDMKIIEDGPYKGMETGVAILTDYESYNGINLRRMRTLMQNVCECNGIPLTVLDQPITITDTSFLNKYVTVFCEPGEKLADGTYTPDNDNVILLAEYEKYKVNGLPPLAPAAGAGASTAAPKGVRAPPPTGADPFAAAGAGVVAAPAPAQPAAAPAAFGSAPAAAAPAAFGSAPVGNGAAPAGATAPAAGAPVNLFS